MSADTQAPASPPNDEAKALERAREAWLTAMEDRKVGPGIVRMRPAAALRPEHVAGCQVMASREQLLEHMPKRGEVAEAGVGEGRFSRAILEIVEPRTLHLIDTRLTKERIRERFTEEVDSQVVRLHEGLSWNMLRELPDGALDFVYIDADHRYKAVSRDIAAAVKKVKRDGYMVLNNYTYWSPLECMKYGVVEAVNEFLLRNNSWRLAFMCLSPRMYCDVALRRDGGK